MTEAAVFARVLNFWALPRSLQGLGRKIATEACCLVWAQGRGCATLRLWSAGGPDGATYEGPTARPADIGGSTGAAESRNENVLWGDEVFIS